MGYKVVASAIKIVGGQNVITCLYYVFKRIADSCRTARNCKSGDSAFKSRDTLFKHPLCRIGKTSVDISRVTQSETV
jgi:hypothetical protein